MDSEETPSVPVPRVVNISPEMVADDLPGVLGILARAAGLSTSAWWNLYAKIRAGATIGVAHIGGEVGKPSRNQKSPENISELAGLYPPNKWKAPVIVAIDEAQRFDGGRFTAHARFLQGIHDNKQGLPLKLVLAGLGDTAAQASAMDLTRGKEVHEIGSLDPEDAGEFMLTCCRRFGMDPRGHEERLLELASQCEGWPRHLHFALQSLGREALKAHGDLSGVPWERILHGARQSRTRYYHGQQSKTMARSAPLVGAIMKSLENNSDLISVQKSIRKNVRDEDGWRFPKNMDIESFLNHLVHQGALPEREDHTISFAIPSFRSYLVRAGGIDLPEPSDDMIRQARNQCRIHGKALSEWREQGFLLERDLQSAEQYLAGPREEYRKTGFLSFRRKRQLQEDLAKGEKRLANIRERQRNRPPPPMPPSPKILGIANCLTNSEAKKAAAEEKVKNLEKEGIFIPAKTPVSAGHVPEGAPAETLLFVIHDQFHVMPSGSYGRNWHHFAVWDGKDADFLHTLNETFPETRMVVEPGLRSIWPGNIPAVESEEADRLMHKAGLGNHLVELDEARGNINEQAYSSGQKGSQCPEDDLPKMKM
ncbi:MAG: hypothetical protein OXC57_06925 [Rhodobacteraceae bacterium]|nr:hypothetical protein [Paracoccaceae bacterium]